MRRSLTFSLLSIVVAMSIPLPAQRAAATGVRTLANVRELHDLMISPASDAVFEASSNQPLDAKGWTTARNQALVLAESGNLLIMRNRASDWIAESRSLIDVGTAVYKAADAKDARAVASLTERVDASCTSCHKKFRPALFAPK